MLLCRPTGKAVHASKGLSHVCTTGKPKARLSTPASCRLLCLLVVRGILLLLICRRHLLLLAVRCRRRGTVGCVRLWLGIRIPLTRRRCGGRHAATITCSMFHCTCQSAPCCREHRHRQWHMCSPTHDAHQLAVKQQLCAVRIMRRWTIGFCTSYSTATHKVDPQGKGSPGGPLYGPGCCAAPGYGTPWLEYPGAPPAWPRW